MKTLNLGVFFLMIIIMIIICAGVVYAEPDWLGDALQNGAGDSVTKDFKAKDLEKPFPKNIDSTYTEIKVGPGEGVLTTVYEVDEFLGSKGCEEFWLEIPGDDLSNYYIKSGGYYNSPSPEVNGQPYLYAKQDFYKFPTAVTVKLTIRPETSLEACYGYGDPFSAQQFGQQVTGRVLWQPTGGSSGGNQIPALSGTWYMGGPINAGMPCSIQADGNYLEFTNENGQTSSGKFIDSETVVASDWENGLKGSITDNGNRINWENNSWWVRK